MDLVSPNEKGGLIPLCAYPVMYIFKAANILRDHPLGLNLDCLALFLGCICEALFLQQEVMNLYDYMYIWIKVCHLFFFIF